MAYTGDLLDIPSVLSFTEATDKYVIYLDSIQDYLTPEEIQECIDKTLLPRIGKPRDIGRMCVFLASDDGEWITGTSMVVDGGWLASIM